MNTKIFLYIAVMAGVTYIIRMLPIILFRKRIKSHFVQSFLYYVPYAVLGSMTIPAVFYATGNVISSVTGFLTAVILAFYGKSLITVAVFATIASFAAEVILGFIK